AVPGWPTGNRRTPLSPTGIVRKLRVLDDVVLSQRVVPRRSPPGDLHLLDFPQELVGSRERFNALTPDDRDAGEIAVFDQLGHQVGCRIHRALEARLCVHLPYSRGQPPVKRLGFHLHSLGRPMKCQVESGLRLAIVGGMRPISAEQVSRPTACRGLWRHVRAAPVSLVAVALAVCGHTIGGGHAPSLILFLEVWALAAIVSWIASRRVFTIWTLT